MDAKASVKLDAGTFVKREPCVKGEPDDKAWLSLPAYHAAPAPVQRKHESKTPGPPLAWIPQPQVAARLPAPTPVQTQHEVKTAGPQLAQLAQFPPPPPPPPQPSMPSNDMGQVAPYPPGNCRRNKGWMPPGRRRYVMRCFNCSKRGHKQDRCLSNQGQGPAPRVQGLAPHVKQELSYETDLVLKPAQPFRADELVRFDMVTLLDEAGLVVDDDDTFAVAKPCVSYRDGSWSIDGGPRHYGKEMMEKGTVAEIVREYLNIRKM